MARLVAAGCARWLIPGRAIAYLTTGTTVCMRPELPGIPVVRDDAADAIERGWHESEEP